MKLLWFKVHHLICAYLSGDFGTYTAVCDYVKKEVVYLGYKGPGCQHFYANVTVPFNQCGGGYSYINCTKEALILPNSVTVNQYTSCNGSDAIQYDNYPQNTCSGYSTTQGATIQLTNVISNQLDILKYQFPIPAINKVKKYFIL
ncbi:hypothetical protein DLAC_03630 [Tieghemostelium lacteum]|uniref:Transmembrane protein n=1 Tax=Tieghemostelium lacteum TaxID=361077 RepID=A0A152A0A4_TIELA|nr:hypothetical protein DLAC_03630 [Tieghemostelium lacteum]|eukprot:KYQ99691.1 hypothetical protein DLAC_03630 [Tieghemostelium lacteum]